MTVPTALALWAGLDRHAAASGHRMRVHLAGGEPFINWVGLVSILRAARDVGLSRPDKVETNAFWATDDGLTRSRLELLAALGVEKLTVSTDVFHQEHIPMQRVQRCVRIARQVFGPSRVIVRRWAFLKNPIEIGHLPQPERDDAYRASFQRYPERLTGRAAECVAPLLPSQPAEAFAGQNCRDEVLGSRHVHIDAHGHVFPGTCAGIILARAGVADPNRAGGDARNLPDVQAAWEQTSRNWPQNPLVAALVAGGSHALLAEARRLGYEELPAGYASKCHLCAHIRRYLVGRKLWSDFVGPPECYGLGVEGSLATGDAAAGGTASVSIGKSTCE